jgi:hypothetical protein
MTMRDTWLLEMAREKKRRAAEGPRLNRVTAVAGRPIGDLWSQLQKEVVRQAALYSKELGDPKGVVVDTPPDEIRMRAKDGPESIIRVDLKTGKLLEIHTTQGGGIRLRTPNAKFMLHSSGDVVLSYGLHASASSLLRRVIG